MTTPAPQPTQPTRKKGYVSNTYADAKGIWHAEVEADWGETYHDVFGCPIRTIYNRASKALTKEVQSRQGATAPPVKVAFQGLRRRGDGSLFALFKERSKP